MSKYGGPILPSSGVSEVEQKEKKEYFNSPNKRNNADNSPNHGGREGVLAKYIRGKYANWYVYFLYDFIVQKLLL